MRRTVRCRWLLIVMSFFLAWVVASQGIAQEKPQETHFAVRSSLDARYVRFIRLNAEAFYANMVGRYFTRGWQKPLVIYYSRKQSDTQQLFEKHGIKGKATYGRYIPETAAIYTHRYMDGGGLSGWGTLFHEIVHHFVHLNHVDAPDWFDEGLACFLGERTRIVKGKLSVGRPNPWRERILRGKIEKGYRIDVWQLMSLSGQMFYADLDNYHVARAFFYWLHKEGHLEPYLKSVLLRGYSLHVLEKTVGKPRLRINSELLAFIKKYCYCAAYFKDGCDAKDSREKEAFFQKALEINPGYQPARLELARCLHKNRDHQSCRANLQVILEDAQSTEHRVALRMMGDSYYKEKDYSTAILHYLKARDYSEFSENAYALYYEMANCSFHLKDWEKAKDLYSKFLENNWEPQRSPNQISFARNYIKWFTNEFESTNVTD